MTPSPRPITGPVFPPVLLTPLARNQIPITPSSGFSSLLEWLIGPREIIYLLDCWFIIEKVKLRKCQMEKLCRARCGGRAGAPKTLQVPTLPNLREFKSESLQATSFWVVMEVSLQRRDWLNHWPLVIDFNLQPLSLPGRWGLGGPENSNLSNYMVDSPGNQPPSLGAFQKSPRKHKLRCGWKGFIINIKTLLPLLSLRNLQAF